MALLISYQGRDTAPWVQAFQAELPQLDIRVYPDVGDPADIEFAALWQHPQGDLHNYPNLKAILSFGAGVEHIVSDPLLPAQIPVVRLVDGAVVHDMALHALHWVLHFHRGYHQYARQQRQGLWQPRAAMPPARRRIGIMGMGQIGQALANLLHGLGFTVTGWGLDPVDVAAGIGYRCGSDALADFLAGSDVLVNALPLTPATAGLISAAELARLPRGACVISESRGGIIDEEALLQALHSDHLDAAALDVFAVEPLPRDSALWTAPDVFVTPHIGGINYPETAAAVMADNIRRVQRGESPGPIYDALKGY
ncbi:2-hydroxyacid dehydrogenase [Marinobacterium rhizophilum]|uniref:Glyoxylate/hydroxypyruvate reductase A n=1 Tax=Marinobacterium rhizophilum TaxID=420402 RepID=A0ABY5HNA3_9GAMM|nr:glyoxylate/hydroxypyruvate reductase A [Marinobacterium rhizophilum]UTW13053.1 glyoxylate/hydroxypyruvate reductase A [Marinobacterium rhizophilum]